MAYRIPLKTTHAAEVFGINNFFSNIVSGIF